MSTDRLPLDEKALDDVLSCVRTHGVNVPPVNDSTMRAIVEQARAVLELAAQVERLAIALRVATSPQACDGSGHTLIYHFGESGEEEGSENVPCSGCCACSQSLVESALALTPAAVLAAHDARVRDAALREAADAVGMAMMPATLASNPKVWKARDSAIAAILALAKEARP